MGRSLLLLKLHAINFIKNKVVFLIMSFFLFSCGGSDVVEETIKYYKSGEKNVFASFDPEGNLLDKYTYNKRGELVYFEQDTLTKHKKLKNYLQGEWVRIAHIFNEDTIYSEYNADSIETSIKYIFTPDSLFEKGALYSGKYFVAYMDTLKIKRKGSWLYDNKDILTQRSGDVNQMENFTILSYSQFVWNDYLHTADRNDQIILRRLSTLNIHPKTDKKEEASSE
jgi:hypothetical protein